MVDAYKIKKWNSPNSVGTPFIAQFGGMRIHPEDAAKLGCTEGDWVQLKTPRGSAKAPIEITDEVEPSYLSMPNGHGLDYTNTDGTLDHRGVSLNELTNTTDRDPFAGTPWHKYVPVHLERLVQR